MEFKKFIFSSYTFLQKSKSQSVEEKIKNSNFISFNFINFNYTSTLEKLIFQTNEALDSISFSGNINRDVIIQDILHIHGDLNSNIIIGVDRYEQFSHLITVKRNELEEYTVKKAINLFSGEQRRENLFNRIIINSDLIYMYGLSLGETDKSRWDIVKNWLECDRKPTLIYFAHDATLKKLNELFLQKMVKKHNIIKNEVLRKIGFAPDNFEKYYDQIFIIDSSDVLNFKLVDENKEPETNMN